jgi:hypothetical protein
LIPTNGPLRGAMRRFLVLARFGWSVIAGVYQRPCGHLIGRKPLEGMLQDWIEAGFVAEIRPHTYYDATRQPAFRTFSGITEGLIPKPLSC